jgi:signal transduction histidine kinase
LAKVWSFDNYSKLTVRSQRSRGGPRANGLQQELLQSPIDSLAANIAVLDEEGKIIAVNRAWCRFADTNGFAFPNHGLETNYLRVCDAAELIESARRAAEGIRDVLGGRRDRFELSFQSRDADAERWNRMTVTRVIGSPAQLAIVAHELIDEVVGSRTILDFEDLIADLAAALVRVPTDELDSELERWLERVVVALDIDRAVIGEINPDDRQLYVTHQSSRPRIPPIPVGMNATKILPWLVDRVLAGKLTVISREEDMPTEAAQDLAYARRTQFKSNVTVPLKIGGVIVGGAAFGTILQHRAWSPRLVQRLRTVAEIFGSALERKRSSLAMRQLREEVQDLSRVTLMGELTASLAHELNQPLGAILNNAQAARRLLRTKKPDLKEVRGAVNGIIRDDVRASDTIRHVRELFRPSAASMAPLDPRRLVSDAERILRQDAQMKRITLRVATPESLPMVRCNRTQLIQVLMNLILNAFDAICANGDGPREVIVAASQPDTGHILLTVTDSGVGISSKVMPKIFDAFFTTKRQGMGMGLAIARSIVESHGGEIRAKSNANRGATVEFTLPVTQ